MIWPVARAFAPRCAGCCSAEDRPSVTHNFKPVSQATNMPANRRQLPSTSPFVSAVTIVERRCWGEKKNNNKCETLTWDAVHRWGLKHDGCIGDRWVIRECYNWNCHDTDCRLLWQLLTASHSTESSHSSFVALTSVKLQTGHKSIINIVHMMFFQVFWSHKIDLCDEQTNI